MQFLAILAIGRVYLSATASLNPRLLSTKPYFLTNCWYSLLSILVEDTGLCFLCSSLTLANFQLDGVRLFAAQQQKSSKTASKKVVSSAKALKSFGLLSTLNPFSNFSTSSKEKAKSDISL